MTDNKDDIERIVEEKEIEETKTPDRARGDGAFAKVAKLTERTIKGIKNTPRNIAIQRYNSRYAKMKQALDTVGQLTRSKEAGRSIDKAELDDAERIAEKNANKLIKLGCNVMKYDGSFRQVRKAKVVRIKKIAVKGIMLQKIVGVVEKIGNWNVTRKARKEMKKTLPDVTKVAMKSSIDTMFDSIDHGEDLSSEIARKLSVENIRSFIPGYDEMIERKKKKEEKKQQNGGTPLEPTIDIIKKERPKTSETEDSTDTDDKSKEKPKTPEIEIKVPTPIEEKKPISDEEFATGLNAFLTRKEKKVETPIEEPIPEPKIKIAKELLELYTEKLAILRQLDENKEITEDLDTRLHTYLDDIDTKINELHEQLNPSKEEVKPEIVVDELSVISVVDQKLEEKSDNLAVNEELNESKKDATVKTDNADSQNDEKTAVETKPQEHISSGDIIPHDPVPKTEKPIAPRKKITTIDGIKITTAPDSCIEYSVDSNGIKKIRIVPAQYATLATAGKIEETGQVKHK